MQQIIADANIVFLIVFGLLFLLFILGFFLLICVIIMHNILYPRLDSILFRAPFFSSAELALYAVWPLSLVRASQYMFLIAYPNFMKRKRFKDLEQELPIGSRIRIASKLYMYLHFSTLLTGVSWFIALAIVIIVEDYFKTFV